MILLHFPADNGFGGGGLAAAIGKVCGGDLLKVVDVIDKAAFDFVHAGVDIAGDGDVDEEHGTVATGVEELLAVRTVKDFLWGSCTGDDDVSTRGLSV